MSDKANALGLMLMKKTLNINPTDVNYRYTWLPGIVDVYIGRDVKTNYLHSFWVGVVMTILSLPVMLLSMVVVPMLKSMYGGFLVMTMIISARLIGGVVGAASGIKVDPSSFHAEIHKNSREQMRQLLVKTLNLPPSEIHVADLDDPQWGEKLKQDVQSPKDLS